MKHKSEKKEKKVVSGKAGSLKIKGGFKAMDSMKKGGGK